ncbi:hypothetical protein [Streptomyces sp. V2I9]|nr:hypothetical protein [Streptomyces sp. V2I9]MDQ0984771.1 hypothetical protein [Streptomyces sp. V2I9]
MSHARGAAGQHRQQHTHHDHANPGLTSRRLAGGANDKEAA